MADPHDLTTVENVRSWLGLKTQDDDPLLARLVTGVSAYIENWVGRPIRSRSFTEIYRGTGGTALLLDGSPILAVSALTIDGIDIAPRASAGQSGRYFDELAIRLDGGQVFPLDARVEITYTAGFAAVPADIEQACIELVALRFKERGWIGQASKNLGGETVSFVTTAMPASVKDLLSQWKRVAP